MGEYSYFIGSSSFICLASSFRAWRLLRHNNKRRAASRRTPPRVAPTAIPAIAPFESDELGDGDADGEGDVVEVIDEPEFTLVAVPLVEVGGDFPVEEDVACDLDAELVTENLAGTPILVEATIGSLTVAVASTPLAECDALAIMMFWLGLPKVLQQILTWLAFFPQISYSDAQHHVLP